MEEEIEAMERLRGGNGRGSEDSAAGGDATLMEAVKLGVVNNATTFGTRYLPDEARVFEQNAWDDVVLGEQDLKNLESEIADHGADELVSVDLAKPRTSACNGELEPMSEDVSGAWERFHVRHITDEGEERFFRQRAWLLRDWPRLGWSAERMEREGVAQHGVSKHVCVEVGCGAGATVIPLLEANPDMLLYAFDCSAAAIRALRAHPVAVACSTRVRAFVHNLVGDSGRGAEERESEERTPLSEEPECSERTESRLGDFIPGQSVNTILLLFALGAIAPADMRNAVLSLRELLVPDCGVVLVRDYAWLDLTQIRLQRAGGAIAGSKNLYRRRDGTTQCFFTEEHLGSLFEACGFRILSLKIINRLLVNRKLRIRMYRRWISAAFANMAQYCIKAAREEDFERILALNHWSVPACSEITMAELKALAAQASCLPTNWVDGVLAAFMIVLPPGVKYASQNYAFFSRTFEEFTYVDRIVVAPEFARQGIGRAMYIYLEDFARKNGSPRLTCEVNVRPRNDSSLAFHEAIGFVSVGEHETETCRTRLLVKEL